MTKTVLQLSLLFVVLVLVQVMCYKILLFGVAVPLVFIYLIMRLPVTWHMNITLTIAFVMGLIVDVFNNTPGMNALCCTLLAAFREPVFALFVPRENEMNNPIPCVDTLGFGSYLKYMSTLVVIFSAMIFLVQAFTLHNWPLTLLRIGASSLLTITLLLALDSLVSTRREKRL